MRLNAFLIAIVLFFFQHCSFNSGQIAGTTSTENARFCGKLLDTLGNPVAKAIVKLIPENYVPSNPDSSITLDTTDADGAYSFDLPGQGAFHLIARRPADPVAVFRDGIHFSQDSTRTVNTLKKTGALVFSIPDSIIPEGGTLYIQGTDIAMDVGSQSARVGLTGLPAGRLPSVFVVPRGLPQTAVPVAENYDIRPSDTTRLNSVLFVCSVHKNILNNLGDSLLRELILSQGISVYSIDDSLLTPKDTEGVQCIVVSSTINDSAPGLQMLVTTGKPVMNLDNVFQRTLGMVGDSHTVDYGKLKDSVSTVVNVDASSAITWDIGDTCSLFGADSEQVNWGKPSSSGHMLLATKEDSSKGVVFYYLPREMMDSLAAPGIRLDFLMQNTQTPTMTPSGKDVFVKSLQWILRQTP